MKCPYKTKDCDKKEWCERCSDRADHIHEDNAVYKMNQQAEEHLDTEDHYDSIEE